MLLGDIISASNEQEWKYKAEAIFNAYAGEAKRRCYLKFPFTQFDMGNDRLPKKDFDITLDEQLFNQLNTIDFWNKTNL